MEDGQIGTDYKDALEMLLDAGAHGANANEKQFIIDGIDKGTTVEIPVVIANGDIQVLSGAVKEAYAIARQLRLQDAPGPDRRKGVAALQSAASFVNHAVRFKDEDSAIWANTDDRSMVSVLDYHRKGATGATRWGEHRGAYRAQPSESWKTWGGGGQLILDQEDFAIFLDANDRELTGGVLPNGKAAPEPSSLITLASNLETYSSAKAKRERDPNTGKLKVAFSSETGFLGDIMPPPSFLISIPVFRDTLAQTLEVRLHVSVVDAVATFKLQIHAAKDVSAKAFEAICNDVAKDSGLPMFLGLPE